MIIKEKAGIFKPKNYLAVSQNLKPTTFKVVLQDFKWYLAMMEKFEALQRKNTWTLVPLNAATKIIGNKWYIESNITQMAISIQSSFGG